MTTTRWWQTPQARAQLQEHLWIHSLRRYRLELSDHPPLGATDPRHRLVHVQPDGLRWPSDPAKRAQIRYAPRGKAHFERAITWLIVEHESAHIRFTGDMPTDAALGWLWNALEDQRIERLMAALYPGRERGFTMLGDTIWVDLAPTDDLLAGCLYHRFEHSRPEHERKFRPAPSQRDLWERQILPLVQQAWQAFDSDAVVEHARVILALLQRDSDAPAPPFPLVFCGCGGGGAQQSAEIPASADAPDPFTGFFGGGTVGTGNGHDPLDPHQAPHEVLLAEVEGTARQLARALYPPQPQRLPRPHRSRGELILDRVIAGDERPFAATVAPAPTRSLAMMVLVDLSRSMEHNGFIDPARQVTMLLDRTSELARYPLGILGFDGQAVPMRIRPLSVGAHLLARRRIAGMTASGGTRLAPALQLAGQLLSATPADRRILFVLHDGDLSADDAQAVTGILRVLPRTIQLQPLYLGADPAIIAANTRLFGQVLTCTTLDALRLNLCAWIRTL